VHTLLECMYMYKCCSTRTELLAEVCIMQTHHSWVKLPKDWNFGGVNRTVKPERQKFQTLITWKLLIRIWRNFYREYAPRVCLRGWSHGSPNKSKTATAAIFNFRKMSITLHWIKISAPNFMGRCITAMHRWSRDQKSKPEVNSRDVIKRTSEA